MANNVRRGGAMERREGKIGVKERHHYELAKKHLLLAKKTKTFGGRSAGANDPIEREWPRQKKSNGNGAFVDDSHK